MFLRLEDSSFDELLEIVTPTIAERDANTREAVTRI
jgi:hypothetical protein